MGMAGGEHRPAPSEDFLQELLRLPAADYTKFPVGVSMEHLHEFLRVYRVHCEDLLREGLQGRFQMFGTMVRYSTLNRCVSAYR